MDEDQDRMYVGCKDHVLSMDLNNITHGTLKVSRWLELVHENSFISSFSFFIFQSYNAKLDL